MEEWRIEFYYDKDLDPVFIHKLFYFLISKGIKYNAKFKGRYSILPKLNEYIGYTEKEVKESTEKLAEIIGTYLKYDLKTALFGIYLDYLGKANFYFHIDITPIENNKCIISLGTNLYSIPDEKTFIIFTNLCKDIFVKFNFKYGASRSQFEGNIPLIEEDFLKVRPNIVNFYSKPLVDKMGREKLLSTPAFKVEEIENGGVMLIVCTEPLGC
jgi:hypothetical protein